MLWSTHAANATFHDARWIFVGDADTLPFERSIIEVTSRYDWREPIIIGRPNRWDGDSDQLLATGGEPCTPETPLCETLDDIRAVADRAACCFCPVVKRAGEWEVDPSRPRGAGSTLGSGALSFRAPRAALYGGTGIVLSRGLLDTIPSSEWAQCAWQLQCGSGDHRLFTCIANLLPAVCLVRMTHNERFMRAALDRPDEPALEDNVYQNTLWSTMQADPLRGPRIIRHFSNASAQPRCPWSMHKLDRECLPGVIRVSHHCHGEGRMPRRGPSDEATQPCWHKEDAAERKRLARRYGWDTISDGVPFDELFRREQKERGI
jgi:hypothetical protein